MPQMSTIPAEFKQQLKNDFLVESERTLVFDRARIAVRGGYGLAAFVYDKKIHWGKFVDREINTPARDRIAYSYKYDGVAHETPMIIVLRRSWLKHPDSLAKTYSLSSVLPIIELNELGMQALKNGQIYALSGHHRVDARDFALEEASKVLGDLVNPKKLTASEDARNYRLLLKLRHDTKAAPVEVLFEG